MVTFLYIFMVGIGIFLLLALLTYTSQTSKLIKAIVLPLLLLIGVLTFDHYKSMLGAPIMYRPVGEYEYIAFNITGAVSGNPSIVVWVFDREIGNRLFKYPYTREDAEKLREAQSRKTEGEGIGKVILDFGEKNSDAINSRDDWAQPGKRVVKQ